MIISVEVIDHKRVATLPWVEQMLGKHRNLPTNRLLLVSKSGFSRNAVAAIDREGGRVQALTPEVIEIDGEAVVKRFFVDTISYTPTGCKVHVRFDGDERVVVVGEPRTGIYAQDGSLLGPLSYFVQDTIGLDAVRQRLMFEAHKHLEKEQVKAFSIKVSMPQLRYHLQRSDTGELHLIEELEIWGNFAVFQTEVPLMLAKLGAGLRLRRGPNCRPPRCTGGNQRSGCADNHDFVADDGCTEPSAAPRPGAAYPLLRPPRPHHRSAFRPCTR